MLNSNILFRRIYCFEAILRLDLEFSSDFFDVQLLLFRWFLLLRRFVLPPLLAELRWFWSLIDFIFLQVVSFVKWTVSHDNVLITSALLLG